MNDNRAVQAPALPPIELIEPDATPIRPRRGPAQVAVEILRSIPNLAKLVYRLLRDPRVPRRTKIVVAGAALYFASPVDLIPELLFPVVGRVDDLIVLAYACDRLMQAVDPEVIREHWDGEGDALEIATALISWASGMLPGPLRRLVER